MSEQNRRDVIAAGVAATALAAAQQALAQQPPGPPQGPPQGPPVLPEGKIGFFEKGNVRIRYMETGSGYPLLALPGGGLNSRMTVWPNAVINCMQHFKSDFRVITMDQRNANGGESTGPIPADDPWNAFADDHLALMDHLRVRRFVYFGNCIGGPFGMKLMERAPDRVAGAVLSQPVGFRPEKPDVMYSSVALWANEYRKRQPDVSQETIDRYGHNLFRARADFVFSVSRDFAAKCQTPILVLPDDNEAHAYQAGIDIASLAPKAEINVYPWVKPPELKARTIERVRAFLKRNQKA
jgi:pimeloyl-ACP methyl ester carboxylesterase